MNSFPSRPLRAALFSLVTLVLFGTTLVATTSPAHASEEVSIAAWGYNGTGQGRLPAGLEGQTVTAVSAGAVPSTLVLTSDGSLHAYGRNYYGQMNIPAALATQRVVAMSAGDRHSLAATSEGALVGWGDNTYGQATIPTALTGKRVVAVSAGEYHSLALSSDGVVTAWGNNGYKQTTVPTALAGLKVTAISAGYLHNLALTADGRLFCWGNNSNGECNMPASLLGKTVVAMAAGQYFSIAATSDGQIITWGSTGSGLGSVPAGLVGKHVVAFSTSVYSCLALTSEGDVFAWGSYNTQTAVPTSIRGATVAIATGGTHNVALLSDGTIVGWGSNTAGQLEFTDPLKGNTVIAVSAGRHNVALTSSHSIVVWGGWSVPVPAELSGNVVAISAGGEHDLALTDSGTVVGWGVNSRGQATVPSSLTGKRVTAISAGWLHSLALTSEGVVVAWGGNYAGQIDIPSSLAGRRVVAVSAGGDHSLALTAEGSVVAWGSNGSGQTSVPDSLTGQRVVAISAGGSHSLALTEAGKVVAWGYNSTGQTSVPAALDGHRIIAIAAGSQNSLALDESGEVFAWGDNAYGEGSVPASLQGGHVAAIAAGQGQNLVLGASLPGPVSIASVVPGDHSATITWLKPSSNGGIPILGYTVTATPGGESCSTDSPDVLTCTITGLSNGANYTFTVAARNGAGSSASTSPSGTVVVGPPPGPVAVVPSDPSGGSGGSNGSGDGTQATIRWLAADSVLPIIGYRATAQPGDRSCETTGALFCTITGLDPNVSYSFTVIAINAAGASELAVPSPPISATATAAPGQVTVSWLPPTSNGGATVTRYKVTSIPDDQMCTTAGALSCTFATLTIGQEYRFQVTATNAVGESAPSEASNAVIAKGLDSVPPMVSGAPDRQPNDAGWFRASVGISWSAVDPDPSSGQPDPSNAATTADTEGAGVAYNSPEFCDHAGNCAAGLLRVSIDSTAPDLRINGVAAGQLFPVGTPVPTPTCTASDNLSGLDGECVVSMPPDWSGLGNHTATATVTDKAGNQSSMSVTITVVDSVPPAVSGSLDRLANSAGWFRAPVRISWSAVDPDPSSGQPDPSSVVTTAAAEGANVAYVSPQFCDTAGNCATGQVKVSLDTTAPQVQLLGVQDGQVWQEGESIPTPACTASDNLSGVDGDCVVSLPSDWSRVGSHTATATATDNAGNQATTSVTITVVYRWDGFMQPINDTAHEVGVDLSAFRAGSTVPVKFALTDGAGGSQIPSRAPVWMTPKKVDPATGAVNEAESALDPTTGTVFKATVDGWQFNWKTDKVMAGYRYRIGAILDDGSTHTVDIILR